MKARSNGMGKCTHTSALKSPKKLESNEYVLSKLANVVPFFAVLAAPKNAWIKAIEIVIIRNDLTKKPNAVPTAVFNCCRDMSVPMILYVPVGAG